jgi:hypothetical protein
MEVGSTATVQIVVGFFDHAILHKDRTPVGNTVELVFKKRATDFTDITTKRIVALNTVILQDRP